MITNFGVLKALAGVISSFFILLAFGLAIAPEDESILLTPSDSWTVQGRDTRKVALREFPAQYRQTRQSSIDSNGGVFRSWTPAKGILPLDISSPPFRPWPYMSVLITGSTRTVSGQVQAYIQCESNGQVREIFKGSVNVNVTEAILAIPETWCPGDARIRLRSSEPGAYVGIGDVYKISLTAFLKSSFIGRLPFFLTAFVIFSLVMFAGASFAKRMGWHHDPVPSAFASLGATSLGLFYLASAALASSGPDEWRWVALVAVLAICLIGLHFAGPEARRETAHHLMPYARIWGGASLVYFVILNLVYNGLGHWEPNYRFWPATWSSDNELPWMFAEAIRQGWDLKALFGGGWLPTDRPPLMAGSHLLLSDVFGLLQANNDGDYLRGPAYTAAAVVLNALWVPAVWWLLKTVGRGLDDRGRMAVLVFIACIPFVLFNTVYGWPKAFGASFVLLAFGLAWQSRNLSMVVPNRSTILLFFGLGAFSMLAHSSTALFLAPLGLLFLFWNWRGNMRTIFVGLGVALALLASWSLYKLAVLPSADPVTKFALTGDYGFGHPEWTLWQMLVDRYGKMSLAQWLEIKQTMLMQVFLPLHHSVTQIGLNSDYGAGVIDKLRAWDFMLLSKGNVAILFFSVIAVWVLLRAWGFRRSQLLYDLAPFLILAGVSVTAWLLIVLVFLAPPVLHHWPQAAVFGLALGGAVVTRLRYPSLFGLALIMMMAYTGAVWILSPLQQALAIDPGAALTLAVLASLVVMSRLLPIGFCSVLSTKNDE